MRELRKTNRKQLGELLVERGVITRDQVQTALDYQKDHQQMLLGEVFVELKFATEKDIAQALTCQYGFPYLPLMNYEIDADVLATVPVDLCRQNGLIPIDKIGKNLTIAMANPLNVRAAERVEEVTGCSVQIFVSTATDVKQAIERYYRSS